MMSTSAFASQCRFGPSLSSPFGWAVWLGKRVYFNENDDYK